MWAGKFTVNYYGDEWMIAGVDVTYLMVIVAVENLLMCVTSEQRKRVIHCPSSLSSACEWIFEGGCEVINWLKIICQWDDTWGWGKDEVRWPVPAWRGRPPSTWENIICTCYARECVLVWGCGKKQHFFPPHLVMHHTRHPWVRYTHRVSIVHVMVVEWRGEGASVLVRL